MFTAFFGHWHRTCHQNGQRQRKNDSPLAVVSALAIGSFLPASAAMDEAAVYRPAVYRPSEARAQTTQVVIQHRRHRRRRAHAKRNSPCESVAERQRARPSAALPEAAKAQPSELSPAAERAPSTTNTNAASIAK